MTPKDQVTEEEEIESVDEEPTTLEGEVAAQATPAQPQVDVETLRQEYDLKLQAAQTDLNKLKSSLQKREADITKEYQQRQQLMEKQLHEARIANMDETQRKQYEANMQTEEYQNLQKQLKETEQKNQETAEVLNAMQFFLQKGVPADRLILNQGYNALTTSGWEYIEEEMTRLRQQVSNPKLQKPDRKTAPPVVTDKASPSKGTTWKELRAKYGSEEAVYQAIESGSLDPSILPS
jgi:hypothetical protein